MMVMTMIVINIYHSITWGFFSGAGRTFVHAVQWRHRYHPEKVGWEPYLRGVVQVARDSHYSSIESENRLESRLYVVLFAIVARGSRHAARGLTKICLEGGSTRYLYSYRSKCMHRFVPTSKQKLNLVYLVDSVHWNPKHYTKLFHFTEKPWK